MAKCLYCYKELPEGAVDFHPACSRKIFGTTTPPLLPYRRDNIVELATQIIRNNVTIPGVQAKLSLDLEKGNKHQASRLTFVGLWGGYILKPQTEQWHHLPELEDLTMHLAEIAGIKVVPHSLIRFEDGELCYITRRIDRTSAGKKIAMEDMCQITLRLTEQKYKGSHEQIAKAIRLYSSVSYLDLAAFWRIVLFSYITGNSDMHLKNFSLYHPEGEGYHLTPAYDLLSTKLVMPEDTEDLALTLNGRKKKLRRSDFEESMHQTGLDDKTIRNIFSGMFKQQNRWDEFISTSFLPNEMKDDYKRFINARLIHLAKDDGQ